MSAVKKKHKINIWSSRTTVNNTTDGESLLTKVETTESGCSYLRLSVAKKGRMTAWRRGGEYYVNLVVHSDIETLYRTLKKHFEE